MNKRVSTTTQANHEFRHFRIEGTARLYSGTAMWNTSLVDISLHGALVERPADWKDAPIGSRYRINLQLDGGIMIGMGATLANITGQRLAFECNKIDINSFAQLKRLIELNLGNVETLNRELTALGA